MKITKVDVFQFRCDVPIPNRPVGCRIYTDEGIYGDGEGSMSYGTGSEAAFGMIEALANMIIGMDPLDNEVIWDKMHRTTFWGQSPGPVVFSGISAIDIALWDIKGKVCNMPLYRLLGGKQRQDLRCYASQLQHGFKGYHDFAFSTDKYVEVSKYVVDELGYDAIKIDFLTFDRDPKLPPLTNEQRRGPMSPYFVQLAEERVAAVREAVGPNVDIIIENHSNLDALSAIQLARAVEKYNIFFFEEPNTPSPKTAKYIRESISIPIANGERIFSRWQYAPYFEDMSIQIAQPDLTSCGGLTEGKKICDMAHTYDVAVQAHVCGTPLSTALSLHLESAIPNFIIHEQHCVCLHQYMKDLCVHDYQPVKGRFVTPELPGIGNEWTEKAMTEARMKKTVTKD
mgnify:CR=1 FL=1